MILAPLALLVSSTAFAAPTADIYFQGDWTFCDVHLLAKAWKVPEAAAGARLDSKVAAGKKDAVLAAITQAAAAITPDGWAACPGFEAGYDWDAAEILAKHWGLGSVEEAKARVESKLIARGAAQLRDTYIAAATAQGKTPAAVAAPSNAADEAGRKQFAGSAFNACDAQLWAKHWGISVPEAKARVGAALLRSEGMEKMEELGQIRTKLASDTALCQFYQLPYSYKDAEKLAKVWQIDVSEAKARVEEKARVGYLDVVDSLLGRGSDAP